MALRDHACAELVRELIGLGLPQYPSNGIHSNPLTPQLIEVLDRENEAHSQGYAKHGPCVSGGPRALGDVALMTCWEFLGIAAFATPAWIS